MAAACMPVASAGGTYVWGPQAVSPMCDCLDGAIASKMLAYVGNNATFLSDLEAMTATDLARSATSKTVADDLARIQWSKCLDVARPTQVKLMHSFSNALIKLRLCVCVCVCVHQIKKTDTRTAVG